MGNPCILLHMHACCLHDSANTALRCQTISNSNIRLINAISIFLHSFFFLHLFAHPSWQWAVCVLFVMKQKKPCHLRPYARKHTCSLGSPTHVRTYNGGYTFFSIFSSLRCLRCVCLLSSAIYNIRKRTVDILILVYHIHSTHLA